MGIFDLSGKRALVSGGSRGIGFGIAHGLADAGAGLVLLARSADRLEQARAELSSAGGKVDVIQFDLRDVDDIPTMYDALVERAGRIDILVNNAGISRRSPAEELPLSDWDEVIRVNLTSVLALSQAFARERITAGLPGRIINIASLMSESVRVQNAAYAASKGGIRQLTKALALDWANHSINVNAIGPGYIRTELNAGLWQDPRFDQWVLESTPLGRWGSPGDVAGAAVFLASSAADFITGQVIYVDGGWLAAL